jgi:hypothetical protein
MQRVYSGMCLAPSDAATIPLLPAPPLPARTWLPHLRWPLQLHLAHEQERNIRLLPHVACGQATVLRFVNFDTQPPPPPHAGTRPGSQPQAALKVAIKMDANFV